MVEFTVRGTFETFGSPAPAAAFMNFDHRQFRFQANPPFTSLMLRLNNLRYGKSELRRGSHDRKTVQENPPVDAPFVRHKDLAALLLPPARRCEANLLSGSQSKKTAIYGIVIPL